MATDTAIPLHPVRSSSISHVGYDAATETLHVQFVNGSHYTYAHVTPAQHEALLQAESVGKHFAAHLRGKHPHTKVG